MSAPETSLVSPSSKDFLPLARLEALVFSTDPISVFAWGSHQYSEAGLTARAEKLAKADAAEQVRIRMAVTKTGTIVGFAQWKFVRNEKWKGDVVDDQDWPEGANIALCERVFGGRGADRNYLKNMEGKKHAGIYLLLHYYTHLPIN